MKTIKIIDLLNKIANGEKVPNKVKKVYGIYVYEYLPNAKNYYDIEDNELALFDEDISLCVNEELEILEDTTEEIEEMTLNGRDIEFGSMSDWLGNYSLNEEKISSAIDSIGIKINELVKAYNKLNNTTYKAENCMTD